MTRKERQDLMIFLGVVVLCLTAVLIAILLRNDWSTTQWSGLAAIAAGVQAVGVVAALGYASGQIKTNQEESRRHRHDELIDRLQAHLYDDLDPAIDEADLGRGTAIRLLELGAEAGDHPEARKMVEERYAEARKAVRDAEVTISSTCRRIERVWVLLGAPDYRLDLQLVMIPFYGYSHQLPFNSSDELTDEKLAPLQDGENAKKRRESSDVLRSLVKAFVASHVADEKRPRS